MLARFVGFNPYENSIDIKTSAENTLLITMPELVPILATVVTVGERQKSLDRVGFSFRKQHNIGGSFLEGNEVVRGLVFSDAIRNIPGFEVQRASVAQSSANQNSTINVVSWRNGANMPGGSCVNYFIDKHRFIETTTGEIDNILQPSDVEAIEAYSPLDTPMEFQQMGSTTCATIVIWTNREIHNHIGGGGGG